MGYNKKNMLERIVEIQNITLKNTKEGRTQKWVYDHLIRPRFYISKSTYYNYLGMPAKAELKKLMNAEEHIRKGE